MAIRWWSYITYESPDGSKEVPAFTLPQINRGYPNLHSNSNTKVLTGQGIVLLTHKDQVVLLQTP